MYREKRFRIRDWDEIKADIDDAASSYPRTRRVFLADGDAFAMSTAQILRILRYLAELFPDLERVTCYASPGNLLEKSVEEMKELRENGLKILYYGVESGDPDILRKVKKGISPGQMVHGCIKATRAGIKLSVTVILGLAGRKGSFRHARETARVINRINPRYLSALTLITGPRKERFAEMMGEDFQYNDAVDNVRELRDLIENLEVTKCIFRSNHASNYLPLAGTLSKSRERLLGEIDSALANPGDYFKDDWMRGL
jgi:radical SAM superfamily enzyme YgiQ (UPF0313 family)